MDGEVSAIGARARILAAGSRFGFNRLYDRCVKTLRSRTAFTPRSVVMEAEYRC